MARPVRAIALLLALGALVNVAVAWTCTAAVDIRAGRVLELYADLGGGHHWEVYRWDRGGGTRVYSQCWSGPAPGPYNVGLPGSLLPGWSSIEPLDSAAPVVSSTIEEAWGFPFRTVTCSFQDTPGPDSAAPGTTGVLRLRSAGRAERSVYLPVKPLWAGSAANTCFYGLLGLIAGAVARDGRRAMARRRAAARPAVTA